VNTKTRHIISGGLIYMKRFIQVSSLALIVVAAAAGSTLSKNSAPQSTQVAAMPGGNPLPMCNPFVQKCPNVR
jgi:hypothetical protein